MRLRTIGLVLAVMAALIAVPTVVLSGESSEGSTCEGTEACASTNATASQSCGLSKVRRKPSAFVGFGGGDSFSLSGESQRCLMNEQVLVGAGFLRHTFNWAQIESSKGRYDFSAYDAWVAEAARHKLKIIPILFDQDDKASFRTKRPAGGGERGAYPPKSNKAFGKFAAAVVKRYGPKGTLWRQGGLTKVPITTYQIWNEPNLPVYWRPKPNPKAFAKMMIAVRKQMRKAPGGKKIEVVSGGLPDSKSSKPGVYKYLDRMYRAGARRGIDALGFHPYARNTKGTLDKLKKVRKIMNKRGHKKGNIWITEIGWATTGPKSDFRLGEGRVVREIKKLVPGLWKARKKLQLRGFQYYTWKDKPPYAGLRDHWGYHAGLLKQDGTRKKTFEAFRKAVSRLR